MLKFLLWKNKVVFYCSKRLSSKKLSLSLIIQCKYLDIDVKSFLPASLLSFSSSCSYSTFTFSIDSLSHSLRPFIMFQAVKVQSLYFLLRSIPKTFAHWVHRIVTFFSTTFSKTSHPGAIWWNIGSRFKFNLAYSAMLIINITIKLILSLVLPLEGLALASSVKLGIGVQFKTELLSVCALASSPCILL